uniref:Uncharacterized protein n=1 Tax=Amphimedon queenslandica TaxID=400682 RepID=A0A1X7VV35_AMPQE
MCIAFIHPLFIMESCFYKLLLLWIRSDTFLDGEVVLKIGQSFSHSNLVVTANRMDHVAHYFKWKIQQSIRMLPHFLPDWQPNPRIDIWHFFWPYP